MTSNYHISKDKEKLDIDFIHDYLSKESYWAGGRTREKVLLTIANSVCYGLYDLDQKQVGFARVITDYVVFAWLMDVFIASSHQDQGLGSMLVAHILADDAFAAVGGFGLRTEDAHGLYKKFGFDAIPKARTWMYKKGSQQ